MKHRTALRALLPLMAALVVAVAACDRPGAYGDASSIVAGAPTGLWTQVEDSVYRMLEPTLYTVRDEKTFTVTHVDPTDTARWAQLQQFRQLLLVGPASDRWIAQALGKARGDTATAPAIVQAYDVWARGQTVTVALLPEPGVDAAGQPVFDETAAAFASLLDPLRSLYDTQFRQLALRRMFSSGVDTALADTLARRVGFRMLFPDVYRRSSLDSVFVFRNDNPDPAELIRQIAVTWRTPIPEGIEGEAGLVFDADQVLTWRQELVDGYYGDAQVNDTTRVFAGPVAFDGGDAWQVQAVWQSPPDAWPAAGPFITRLVPCEAQDRLYLIDAWLYAPGKEKYEYMIQLETLLDSFRCAD